MSESHKESIRIHLQLWSHYNILYWTVVSISTFGLIGSEILLLLNYWNILDNHRIDIGLILLSTVSLFFFKITSIFHTYRTYHMNKVNDLTEKSDDEFIPPLSDIATTRFAKSRGFVAASILYYLIFAVGIYFATFFVFIDIESDWIYLICIIAPIPILVGFFIFFIIRVTKWNIKGKLKESK